MDKITLKDMHADAKREVAMRRNVYAKRVAAGQMTVPAAERQIAIMDATAIMLGALVASGYVDPDMVIEHAQR